MSASRLRARLSRASAWAFALAASGFLLHLGQPTAGAATAEETKDAGIVECTQSLLKKHNPGMAVVSDKAVCFEAYISNFDTGNAAPGNTRQGVLGVPHWVSHRVARAPSTSAEGRKRPREWLTIPELQEQGIAPTNKSYHFSQRFRQRHSDWYERGHLAQKYLAERLGESAGWYTHNVANAVPQRGQFNKGPWLTLECLTGAWANRYGEVWVVSGPVFTPGYPSQWLRSDSNRSALPVAIPDHLFKIVARMDSSGVWEFLGFIYPQEDRRYSKGPWDPMVWVASITRIEQLTGQAFLDGAPATAKSRKNQVAANLWSVKKENFDSGCKRFAKDIP